MLINQCFSMHGGDKNSPDNLAVTQSRNKLYWLNANPTAALLKSELFIA